MLGIFLQTATGQTAAGNIGVLAPVFVFLVVAFVLGAILKKTEVLGDNIWVSVIVSLAITAIFVGVVSVREFVLAIVPWFAVLLMAAFFILVLTSIICTESIPKRFLVWFFLIAMIIVFLVGAINAFGGGLAPYLPGPFFGVGGDPLTLFFLDWLYSPAVIGAIGLIIAAVVVSAVLIKFGDNGD